MKGLIHTLTWPQHASMMCRINGASTSTGVWLCRSWRWWRRLGQASPSLSIQSWSSCRGDTTWDQFSQDPWRISSQGKLCQAAAAAEAEEAGVGVLAATAVVAVAAAENTKILGWESLGGGHEGVGVVRCAPTRPFPSGRVEISNPPVLAVGLLLFHPINQY